MKLKGVLKKKHGDNFGSSNRTVTVDFRKNPEIVEITDKSSESSHSKAKVIKPVDLSNRPSTTIVLNDNSGKPSKTIKLRKNSFNQSFINPGANYRVGMDYDEKRGWRIISSTFSFLLIIHNLDNITPLSSQQELFISVINELKMEKKKMAVKNSSKIKKIGTIYREKRYHALFINQIVISFSNF